MKQRINSIKLSKQIRETSLRMVSYGKASHIGSALSIADVLAVLYSRVLSFKSNDSKFSQRDRFILSKGHACVALYSVLYHLGFISKDDIDSYGRDFSKLSSHVSHKVNGVEFSTGALGHGLPVAVGKAMSAKIQKKTWRVYVIMGDGELQEGSVWEAIMFSSHHKLNNITLVIDANNLQSLKTVDETLSINPIASKFKSFGWECAEIDGHDHEMLFKELNSFNEKPKCIIAKTIKGKGVSFMENKIEWHYKFPSNDELERALSEVRNA